jgi:hypothetical protein
MVYLGLLNLFCNVEKKKQISFIKEACPRITGVKSTRSIHQEVLDLTCPHCVYETF